VQSPIDLSLQGKRVLITGGLGFIGSSLARACLAHGAEVSLLDCLVPGLGGNWYNLEGIRDQVQVCIADLADETALIPLVHDTHILFNLAGQGSHSASMRKPLQDLQINAFNHLRLLELCRQHNPQVKVVYAATRQFYGRPGAIPVDEAHPLQPIDYNGVSKLAGEMYHMVCYRAYGMNTTSLRLTNTYGPRMRVKDGRLGFIGLWVKCLLDGGTIEVYGDGTQVRDFNYIDDVTRAFLLAALSPGTAGEVYNLGGDEPTRLIDLASLMIELNGSGMFKLVPFPPERRRIDIGSYQGNYQKSKRSLGWQPLTLLADGLRQTLDYYRQNLKHYA